MSTMLIGFLILFSGYLTLKNYVLGVQVRIYRAGFVQARSIINGLVNGSPEYKAQLTKEILEIEGLVTKQ